MKQLLDSFSELSSKLGQETLGQNVGRMVEMAWAWGSVGDADFWAGN